MYNINILKINKKYYFLFIDIFIYAFKDFINNSLYVTI